MTPDEVRQSITGWSSGDDNLEYTGEQSEPGADFVLGVRSVGDRGGPVDLQVLHQGGDRSESIHEPFRTITGAHRGEKALASATLVQVGYGEREGQAPRALNIRGWSSPTTLYVPVTVSG